MTSERAVDGRTSLRFVKQRFTRGLYPGDIVIMDNLSIHKMLVVREAILDAGGSRSTSQPTAPSSTPSSDCGRT